MTTDQKPQPKSPHLFTCYGGPLDGGLFIDPSEARNDGSIHIQIQKVKWHEAPEIIDPKYVWKAAGEDEIGTHIAIYKKNAKSGRWAFVSMRHWKVKE